MKEYLKAREWPLWTLLAVCIARLWLIPLPSSFWLDELVTAFVVKHPGHASFAVAPQVPQSIYYWLPRAMLTLFGQSEVSFRIPSLLAMGITLWLVSLLAARLIHPAAGWFAVFAALSLRGIHYNAVDARPYALGMMMAVASLYFLVRWLDSARWTDAALFVVAAALVWRVHLIYWPYYAVPAIYATAELAKNDTPVRWPQWTLVAGTTALALLPQATTALRLVHGAQFHVIVPLPTLHVFEHELHWNVPLLCGTAAWAAWLWHRRRSDKIQSSAWILILSSWLCQPVGLYLYSVLTGNSVYTARYLSIMLPGAALAATACIAVFLPAAGWRIAAVIMAIAALIFQGHWDTLWFRHDISDWRGAAAEVNRFAPDAATPIVVPSPFIEARPPAWTGDYPLPGFLYAELDRYPIAGRLFLLPFDNSDGIPRAIEFVGSGSLTRTGKWAIYGQGPQVRAWRDWFSRQPEMAAWRSSIREFGDVDVAEFQRE